MSDTYDHDIDEQCAEAQETSAVEAWPDQFKTALGKVVNLVGKPYSGMLALISYSTSKIQGNALVITGIHDVGSLLDETERLYEDGVLEDENLEECDSIILPIDGVDLSDSLKGVIIDCDLRSYTNGVNWLINPDSDALHDSSNIVNVLRSVLSFIKTMKHLRNKGISFNRIDGHHFFFNTEYGEFQFVFDGVDIAQMDAVDKSYDTSYQYAISCLLMYMLTGTKIDEQVGTMVTLSILKKDDDEEGLAWNQETDTLEGSPAALSVWNTLPEKLRTTLFDVSFAQKKRIVTLDEWEILLDEGIAEAEACVFCGNFVFKTAKRCICCGNTTEKDDLLTKWLVENSNQPKYLKFAFGRGTTLSGEVLGISSKSSDFMRLMYNPKTNVLGLKNLSNLSWFSTEDGNQKEIIPGKVLLIEDELEITFDGYPDVSMRFLGYEVK